MNERTTVRPPATPAAPDRAARGAAPRRRAVLVLAVVGAVCVVAGLTIRVLAPADSAALTAFRPNGSTQLTVLTPPSYGFVLGLRATRRVSVSHVLATGEGGGGVTTTLAALTTGDFVSARALLADPAVAASGPVDVAPGQDAFVVVTVRVDCARPVPVTAVQLAFTTGGERVAQFVDLGDLRAEVATATQAACAP